MQGIRRFDDTFTPVIPYAGAKGIWFQIGSLVHCNLQEQNKYSGTWSYYYIQSRSVGIGYTICRWIDSYFVSNVRKIER